MSIAAILAVLSSLVTSTTGLTLGAVLISWITGKGLTTLISLPWAQKVMGQLIQSAKGPAIVADKVLKAGPLKMFTNPILALLVFASLWFSTFVDKIMEGEDDETTKMVNNLRSSILTTGSTDRALYLKAKTMSHEQVNIVSLMAEAMTTPAAKLTDSQKIVLSAAEAVGDQLQASRTPT